MVVETMARKDLENLYLFLLFINFCMYTIVLGVGAWAVNRAIDDGFVIGKRFDLPAHFSPIYFPMGNAATGFFVVFSLIAGAVGVASTISGLNYVRFWGPDGFLDGLPAAASTGTVAWTLTLLALGFAWKEIDLPSRNGRLKAMEAFIIILSATQLVYIAAIYGGSAIRAVEKKQERTAS